MLGSFSEGGWERLYAEAYKNLVPGGWIEQYEVDPPFYCDDGTIASDSPLASWGSYFIEAGKKSGKGLDTAVTMRNKIEAAGFINVSEKMRKVPCGSWARNELLRDIGKVQAESLKVGCEG